MPVRWVAKLIKLQTFDFKGHVSPITKEHLAEVAKQGIVAANPLDDIRKLVGAVDFDNPPVGITDPSDSISKLAELIEKVQRAPTEPCVTDTTIQAIAELRGVLDEMRQAPLPFPVDLWNKFQGTMPTVLGELEKALNTPVQDAASVVQIAVSKTVQELQAEVNSVTQNMMSYYRCSKGHPHRHYCG